METRNDIKGITPGAQENTPPEGAPAPPAKDGEGASPFEKLLSASLQSAEPRTLILNNMPPASSAPLPDIQMCLESGIPQPPPPPQTEEARFREILAVVMRHEGSGYVRRDGGKESSKYGILQSTARSFGYQGDIKNISRSQAEGIYKKLWDRSGAAALPYPLSLVHFDTYINSPAAARKIVRQAGGDLEQYLDLRAQRYQRLVSLRPERYAKYLKGWMNRIAGLREIVLKHQQIQSVADRPSSPSRSSGPGQV